MGNYEAFRRWVQSADPTQRRISVCSPIEEAAILGDVEAVLICLQHAHPSATALRYAEQHNQQQIVELIRRGPG